MIRFEVREDCMGRISALIARCIRSPGVEGFSRRMWGLSGFADLERLGAECSTSEDVLVAAAR